MMMIYLAFASVITMVLAAGVCFGVIACAPDTEYDEIARASVIVRSPNWRPRARIYCAWARSSMHPARPNRPVATMREP